MPKENEIITLLLGGGRYFFMEITKSNKIIINDIMYSLSIAITSFRGDDGITAQLPRKRGYTLVCERGSARWAMFPTSF